MNAVQWEAGSTGLVTTLELARVLREAGVIDRFGGGGAQSSDWGGGEELAVEGMEEEP